MRRLLIFDIETSPNVGFFWKSGYKLNIPPENIIKERAIICICYKWVGQSKVYSLQWDSKQNDKKMLQEFIKVANQADELIAHNGDNFDLKWIRTRCFIHKIPMMPEFTTVDTLKAARNGFNFNSNKLDYISKLIGNKGKLHTSFGLWVEICLNKCTKSLNYMVKYCKADVKELESVYLRLRPYLKAKSSIADHKGCCPNCNSDRMGVNAYKVSAAGVKYVQLQCKNCGQYSKVNRAQYEKTKV